MILFVPVFSFIYTSFSLFSLVFFVQCYVFICCPLLPSVLPCCNNSLIPPACTRDSNLLSSSLSLDYSSLTFTMKWPSKFSSFSMRLLLDNLLCFLDVFELLLLPLLLSECFYASLFFIFFFLTILFYCFVYLSFECFWLFTIAMLALVEFPCCYMSNLSILVAFDFLIALELGSSCGWYYALQLWWVVAGSKPYY